MLKLKATGQISSRRLQRRVKRCKRLDRLKDQPWDDADARRLAKTTDQYRDKLTPFLHHAELDGTNNAASGPAPAVVMRKITGAA